MPTVKTTLNAKNLEALGAERLAALVMEVAEGDAARKRIARAALLEAAGGSALATAVSKRLITLRRSKSRVNYRKRRAFIDDLDRQRTLIASQIAIDTPKEALDLMWRFMALADAVHARVDDSAGAMGAVFHQACRDMGTIAAKANLPSDNLARQVFHALTDANDHGEFDVLVEAMAPALGEDGLNRLSALLGGDDATAPKKARALRAIADARGDVDAYIAGYTAQQRSVPLIAARIADRLVAADRAAEALDALDAALPSGRYGREEWTEARLRAFEAAGRPADAQSLRWQVFEREWDARILREYLSRLPDFEDIEAEDRALDLVAAGHDVHEALDFLIAWPAHDRAVALIDARRDALDGDRYAVLGPAADALESSHPLAATLLLRVMIGDTLARAKSSRYRHAARHLRTCAFLDGIIGSWGDVEPHDDYVTRLREVHARRAQFWYLVSDDD